VLPCRAPRCLTGVCSYAPHRPNPPLSSDPKGSELVNCAISFNEEGAQTKRERAGDLHLRQINLISPAGRRRHRFDSRSRDTGGWEVGLCALFPMIHLPRTRRGGYFSGVTEGRGLCYF